jgi:mono/diheme cytochrome c family protein
MIRRIRMLAIVPLAALLMAAASGAWLARVPAADHDRVNPVAGQPQAIEAGRNLYRNNCAQCHGAEGEGRGRRPPLVSPRIASATDGDLSWILRNGEPFRGMPAWSRLPEGQRWQIVAYLRSLQPASAPAARGVTP